MEHNSPQRTWKYSQHFWNGPLSPILSASILSIFQKDSPGKMLFGCTVPAARSKNKIQEELCFDTPLPLPTANSTLAWSWSLSWIQLRDRGDVQGSGAFILRTWSESKRRWEAPWLSHSVHTWLKQLIPPWQKQGCAQWCCWETAQDTPKIPGMMLVVCKLKLQQTFPRRRVTHKRAC